MPFAFCAFVLSLLLSGHCLAAMRVFNGGVAGQSTAEIDDRTDAELRTYSPDIVVLFAGMNDAANDRKLLSPAASRMHLQSIVRKCQAAGARVVLVTVHQPDITRLMQRHSPAAYGDRTPEQRIRDVDDAIVSLGAELHLPVVDFAAALHEKGGATAEWSTDGVHLTAKGYGLLARTVFQQLQSIGTSRSVLCLGDSLTYGIGVRTPNAPDTAETYPSQLSHLR